RPRPPTAPPPRPAPARGPAGPPGPARPAARTAPSGWRSASRPPPSVGPRPGGGLAQRPRAPERLDLRHDRPALLVRVVEVRRDADAALRPPVHHEAALDQPLAGVLRPLEVHAHRVAPPDFEGSE